MVDDVVKFWITELEFSQRNHCDHCDHCVKDSYVNQEIWAGTTLIVTTKFIMELLSLRSVVTCMEIH